MLFCNSRRLHHQQSSTLSRHRIHELFHCVRLARRLERPFRSEVRDPCTFGSRGTRLRMIGVSGVREDH
jgi:hypothetical protein